MNIHTVADLVLVVINDGNGDQCGVDYQGRITAGRAKDLMAFGRMVVRYNPKAQPKEIRLAASQLLAYYVQHVSELDTIAGQS